MSNDAINQCYEVQGLPLTAKFVLFILADHANDETLEAWCSVTTISKGTGLSERATRYALRKLESSGLILVTSRQIGRSRTYRVFPAGITVQRMVKERQSVPQTPAPRAPVSVHSPRHHMPPLVPTNGGTTCPNPGTTCPTGGAPRAPEALVEASMKPLRAHDAGVPAHAPARARPPTPNPAIDIAQPPKPENPNPSLPDSQGQPVAKRRDWNPVPLGLFEALRAKIISPEFRSQLPENEPSSESA